MARMAITAHFEDLANDPGASRAARRTLKLDARGERASGDAAEVTVHNASTTGLLLETETPLEEGERIAIDLPQAGPTVARVVWTSGKLHGCQFEDPISAATLSAAQLRSAVENRLDIGDGPPAAVTASLGVRLQQLRKSRGLTLASLAATLGVSKPTVWAWEHGKARPVESRFPALADALGVERESLVPASGGPVSGELLDRCRTQIGDAAGVSPASVRIFIEL